MLAFEATVVRVEGRGGLEPHLRVEIVEVAEEVLGGLVHGHAAGRDVLVDFTLTFLPLLSPEPVLIGRDGQSGPQLQDAVGALGHLQLRPGLVQVQSATDVGGQRDGAAALHAEVAVLEW